MVVYSFYIFDRHAECIYHKQWVPAPGSGSGSATTTKTAPATADGGGDSRAISSATATSSASKRPSDRLSAKDDAKLIFGTVFSLRNMVRKLGGAEDNFISFRTAQYKVHYYETATNLKLVMLSDTKTSNLRVVLHQIYVNLYVEYAPARALFALRAGPLADG
ncbi:MAG: TRAPP subunit bet5 [Phylliscum demangeonii]|nr:MAG: TRAPP subunit bet5 [Phylliscum demangeonii]